MNLKTLAFRGDSSGSVIVAVAVSQVSPGEVLGPPGAHSCAALSTAAPEGAVPVTKSKVDSRSSPSEAHRGASARDCLNGPRLSPRLCRQRKKVWRGPPTRPQAAGLRQAREPQGQQGRSSSRHALHLATPGPLPVSQHRACAADQQPAGCLSRAREGGSSPPAWVGVFNKEFRRWATPELRGLSGEEGEDGGGQGVCGRWTEE